MGERAKNVSGKGEDEKKISIYTLNIAFTNTKWHHLNFVAGGIYTAKFKGLLLSLKSRLFDGRESATGKYILIKRRIRMLSLYWVFRYNLIVEV